MKCIVTGGAGFIGSNLVDRLIDDGHEVIVLDDLSTGNGENINSKAKFYKVDVSKKSDFYLGWRKDRENFGWTGLFEGVDVVFHLAALARVQPSIENPLPYHDKNVNGLINVLEECREHGVKKLVFSSSSSVYGDVEEKDLPTSESAGLNPMSPYALHKLVGEQYCKLYSELYDMETVSLRYFNVYGERQSLEGAYCLVMGIFAQQRLKGEPMTINGDGEQRRDFTYVGDVVEANVQAAFSDRKLKGDVLNVGNGDSKSVNEIANMIGGEKVYRDPVIEPRKTLADNTKISDYFNWKPTVKIEEWVEKWKKDIGL